ncbi:MAG: SDR family oxidoreductase [Bacteroidota bacterium]|nr:SDR family oxidoreductase [Bacteroidota bacterium]
MSLTGKKAVITGISKGIGRALTEQLLDKGAIVAGIGLNQPNYTHPNLHFVKASVRKQEEVEMAFTEALEKLENRVDILVNNAGLGYFGYFEEMPVEQVMEIFEVNVMGLYFVTRCTIPVMKQQLSGHIINISSIAGLEGMEQVAAYCGAKHAVRGITDSLFRELRTFGIKVTGVYPGSVQTDFFNNVESITAHDRMLQPEEVASQIINALETSDNFLMNTLVFRPLNVKPRK